MYKHIYIYVHVHICTHMYTCADICTPMYTYVHVCRHMYTYVQLCTHMYAYVHTYTHLYPYEHMRTHRYICTHVHMDDYACDIVYDLSQHLRHMRLERLGRARSGVHDDGDAYLQRCVCFLHWPTSKQSHPLPPSPQRLPSAFQHRQETLQLGPNRLRHMQMSSRSRWE